METSMFDHHPLQDFDHDHAGQGELHDTMTRSADSRGAGQMDWTNDSSAEGCLDLSTRRGPLSTFPPGMAMGIGVGRTAMDFSRRRSGNTFGTFGFLLILLASIWIVPASAVFIQFENCLSQSVQDNSPLQLQLVPMFFNAVFNTTDPSHNLNVVVYTNVTGSEVGNRQYLLPNASNPYWSSNNDTSYGGKILDVPDPAGVNKETTLDNKVAVLTYQPYTSSTSFCGSLKDNESCPLIPTFNASGVNPYDFPSYGFTNNFYSTYAFTSFTATLLVKYGDANVTPIGCVSASITPDIGTTLSSVVKYVPVIILVFVAFATAFAAIYSPWGSTDIFRWTTNYGRDADLLRLVTPGFGDCLQYIQFVALTGGLTLNYPGFYQPIVSKVSWSALMFNESFVSNTTTESLVDGIYVTNGTYGLDNLRQLVGMGAADDVWAGMVIWLLIILASVLVIIQVGFFVRWAYRHINNTTEEDLRAKNMPFSVGNVIRIVFNYFLLPIVALSMFQLVVAARSPAYTVALSVVMLVLVIGFAGWLLYIIASTRPKAFLFDDLPTVLLYGSLYNTYSDNAAPFALVPMLLTFIRGVAIGAIQPSGIAQLVILAICEVITVLTLHAFRPFHSPTSMNAFHTFFAVIRFATILLMISFAPSLGVTDGPKGWIGYAILLTHAIVLICGFMLNALQTIVEVAARMAGAGGDESGATRGGLAKVFGMRELSRRLPRRDAGSRQSQLSSAAILDTENDRKSYILENGRLRSQSAGSAGILLGRQSMGNDFNGTDPFGAIPSHQVGSGQSSYTPTTPGESSTFSFLPSAAAPSGLGRNRGPILGLNTAEAADPYYRPPRFRRPTLDAYSPGAKSRGSWASGDWTNKRNSQPDLSSPEQLEEGPSISGRNTPINPAVPPDASQVEPRRSKADYTTREVDFYYGVRGPALNANIPSRRIKTGPADPTGIPASAAGWFKGLFGGKTKEKGKGFEVVRSSRMPPGMGVRNGPGQETPPEGIPIATAGGNRSGPIDSDDDESVVAGPSTARQIDPAPVPVITNRNENKNDHDNTLVSPLESDDEVSEGEEEFEMTRISDLPPNLSALDIPGGGIELPSRFPSVAASKASTRRAKTSDPALIPDVPTRVPSTTPTLPRKSSRRKSQSVDMTKPGNDFLQAHRAQASVDSSSRLPFERTNSKKRQSDISTRSGITDPSTDLGHSRNSSSALGNLSADILNDRPTSMGYVNHHSIRTINPSNNPQYLGSSAEVVDGRHSGASSMEHERQP